MNYPRAHNRPGPSKTALPVSLDDLVEETSRDHDSRRHSARESTDEDDELEAYMKNLEEKATRQEKMPIKKVRIEPTGSDDSDSAIDDNKLDEIEKTAIESQQEQDVENIKADVQAAIANVNAPTNKTIKRLNQLGTRDVSYMPFKKNFYHEVAELAMMSKEEVTELRMSLENIKVVGKSCPKPVTCWAHCGLSKKVMEVLKKSQYLAPTPIQAQAIPAIMSGRDVIGIAKTGCGKTLSFLLPMFRHILAQPKLERHDGPIAVIITPTRELATQICDDALKFSRSLGLRVVAIYGGPNISEQIGMLKPGAEIVVCTPGRMIEMLTVNSGRVTNLNRCTYLVLDEADRLFDMGFEKQIRSIVNLIRPDRQTVMFSATFPKILEAHARKILTDPIAIQVGNRSIVCKDVTQAIELIEEDDKFPRLLEIFMKHVDRENSAIVFVSKQEKADSLLKDLMENYDPNCLILHGGIDKDDRISTFDSFRKGHARVLVATSVAARGLDVKNCICVVNYDCPNHYEDYVHRCGRTGRAGNKGFAYTYITPDQGPLAADIIKALELSGQPVPEQLQKLWDTYKADAEANGRKIWSSSGFSGKGFKFDEAETQLINEKKKNQKKSLGIQNSSDEEEEDGDTSKDLDTLESEVRNLAGGSKGARARVRVIAPKAESSNQVKDAQAAGASPAVGPKDLAATTGNQQPANQMLLSKLDLVRQRASILCRRKGLEPISEHSTPVVDSKIAGSDLRNRSTVYSHKSDLLDTTGPVPQPNPSSKERLEMQMEINDFHQQVRRRLTSKETLNKVSEQCEVGITVRGKFCPPGDRPSEPKLYLAIEGKFQANLDNAHRELLLVVKDEYNRMNSAPASRGRYRIM